jgi:hypothetical protein
MMISHLVQPQSVEMEPIVFREIEEGLALIMEELQGG